MGNGRYFYVGDFHSATTGNKVFTALNNQRLDFGGQTVFGQLAEEMTLYIVFKALHKLLDSAGNGVIYNLADTA